MTLKSIKRSLWLGTQVGLGFAVSLALGWLVISGLDWSLVRKAFAEMSIVMGLLALILFMAGLHLRAYRWRVLFVNEPISVPRLFVVENEGLGVNNLVPIRVAAEAVQWTVLTVKDGVNGATTLVTLGMTRVMDIVVSSVIILVGFIFMPELKSFAVYVMGVFGFAIVAVILIPVLSWGSKTLPIIQRFPPLAAFAAAVAALERSPVRLGYALLLSFTYWISVGLTVWLVAVGMNVNISPITATVVILGTLFFATAVPAAPGSIGTFEAAMVYMLGFFGVGKELGFGFSILVHALLFIPPSIIALIFLPGEGIGTFRQLRTLIGKFQRVTNRTSV